MDVFVLWYSPKDTAFTDTPDFRLWLGRLWLSVLAEWDLSV